MILVNFFISSNVVLLKQKSLQQTSKARPTSSPGAGGAKW
jgi:hypothetical protein